jgi:hypothetical protein
MGVNSFLISVLIRGAGIPGRWHPGLKGHEGTSTCQRGARERRKAKMMGQVPVHCCDSLRLEFRRIVEPGREKSVGRVASVGVSVWGRGAAARGGSEGLYSRAAETASALESA